MIELNIEADLQESATQLGVAYKEHKAAEKNKNDARAYFFLNALEELRNADIQTRTVVTEAVDKEAAELYVKRQNPRWEIISVREDEEITGKSGSDGYETRIFHVALQEDRYYLPFKFVNREDGMVYERRIQEGSLLLDDEFLAQDNPYLYNVATFTLPWGDVIPRPFESLSKRHQEALKKYLYYGEPTIKLPAPRKAKATELEEEDDSQEC